MELWDFFKNTLENQLGVVVFLKEGIGVGMLGLIKSEFGIVYVLEIILNFVSFGLLDFDLSLIIFEFDIGNN